MHLGIVAVGLLAPTTLYLLLARRGPLQRSSIWLTTIIGAVSGAGIAVGLSFQHATANIHSGYAWAFIGLWVELVILGAPVGACVGALVGSLAVWRRPATFLVALLALAGAVGWMFPASRDTIDCDVQLDRCQDLYGMSRHPSQSTSIDANLRPA